MKKNITYFSFLFFTFFSFVIVAQNKTEEAKAIDSLLHALNTSTDTTKVNILNQLSRNYLNIDQYEKVLLYSQQAKEEAEKINYKRGIASALNNIGTIYSVHGNYSKAIATILNSLRISEQMGYKRSAANSYNLMGIIYWKQKNYQLALLNYSNSLKIRSEFSDKLGMAACYNNIGNIYKAQGEYEKALNVYFKCLYLTQEMEKSFSKNAYKFSLAAVYNNIGSIFFEKGDYEKALGNYKKALKIKEEINAKSAMASSYENIGNVYIKLKAFKEAYFNLNKSLTLFTELDAKSGIEEVTNGLSNLYKEQGDYKQAYKYHKLFSNLKDTLFNESSSKQIAEMNVKYQSEKKEKEIELLTKDKNLQQAEISKQKLIRNGIVIGLLLALLFGFVLFNRFRVTNKQKKIIESQNHQIVESISYSKKIQDSLLPSIDVMQKALPDSFVFNAPKDIVSGDFYFFKEVDNYILLACVDCTGHGVPGGFMSTLGSLLLDKITDNKQLSPAEILNKLSDEIIRVLHQQKDGEIQDGMDLSVCLIDKVNHKIEFSGARNGIIIVSDYQAKRFKANSLPVGGNYMKKGQAIVRNFQTESIQLNENDWVYMYTDGFMEQVGGTAALPMNYKQFEQHLIAVSNKETAESKNKFLQTELDNWRSEAERTDDVLIIGFQI